MNLIKHKKLNDLLSLNDTFNSLFNDDLFSMKSLTPKTDIIQTDDKIKLKMDCPGVSSENLKITYKDNILTISGKNENELQEKEENYYKLERSYGSFSRSFVLPTPIEEESIVAEYKDGVISVIANKIETTKPRDIEIKIINGNENNTKSLLAIAGNKGG